MAVVGFAGSEYHRARVSGPILHVESVFSLMNAKEILDAEFLEIRAKVLEVAAALDRLDRADGDVSDDDRMKKIVAAINMLTGACEDPKRAEELQLLFSREYDASWKQAFDVAVRT